MKIYALIYIEPCCYYSDSETLMMCSTKVSDIESAIREKPYIEFKQFRIEVWENGVHVKSKDILFWMN